MSYFQFSHKKISLCDVKIASTSSCTPAAEARLPISDLKPLSVQNDKLTLEHVRHQPRHASGQQVEKINSLGVLNYWLVLFVFVLAKAKMPE